MITLVSSLLGLGPTLMHRTVVICLHVHEAYSFCILIVNVDITDVGVAYFWLVPTLNGCMLNIIALIVTI